MTGSRHRAIWRAHTRGGARDLRHEVVGTVWPTGEVDVATQLLRGGYRPETMRIDPAAMPPAVAAHTTSAFSRPGDLVLDPDCGAGTTIVEALRLGRHAIGMAGTRRSWQIARANVTATKAEGAPVDGMVLVLDRRPNTLRVAHAAGFTGRVDLILTALRPPTSRLAPLTLDGAIARLRTLLADARTLLRPSGRVVVTTAPYRSPDDPTELVDIPGLISSVATEIGLVPMTRCIALTMPTAGARRPLNRLIGGQRSAIASAEELSGHPVALSCHQTVLVFGPACDHQAGAMASSEPPDYLRCGCERCLAA